MKRHPLHRVLALILAAVLVLGNLPAANAAPELRVEKVDADVNLDRGDRLIPDSSGSEAHKPTDMVRVAILLEEAPTAGAGYSTHAIASNPQALAYHADLSRSQQLLARSISEQALAGEKLDVVWNLTLVANLISANVPYGVIDAIRAVDGVRDVVLERQYSPETVETDMYSSVSMTGASAVWETGYTGAGSRVAIVDTGTDTDHQSFDNGAYLYALEELAAEKGQTAEQYTESLDLLDTEEIAGVLELLNATERIGADAEEYYLNEKLPFAANYVDYNLTVDHDSDYQGSHGSHVAGIAAANRYIPDGDGYTEAMQSVRMSGVAPDAQIITLKVFGNANGPFDSDYFAAIEDAIWLGCDSVNLSLGSGDPGTSTNELFADLLDFLATTDTVVVMSAGNSGHWAENTFNGWLYDDGVSFHTSGSPGTYTNSLSVASVDNDGTVGSYFTVDDTMVVYSEGSGYYNDPMTDLDYSADGSGTAYDYIFIDGLGYESDYEGIDLTGKVVFCSRGDSAFYEKANVAASLGAIAVVIYNNTSGTLGMDLSDYHYSAPCVLITKSDGQAVRAASQAAVTDSGVTYYTGSLTVHKDLGAASYDSDYYTMSAFSSWGVPGSLELKPEITAPGGLIWSVNGVDTSGSAYELMSGTSMAAPQVTGMVALAAEYIRDRGLEEQTGLSPRQLAQSLLMSTAEPLFEEASGSYYSILNQGAGLARVDRVVEAESYVLVDGMADGKVKVELGEDPDRTGVYEFSFTLRNLSGEAMTYALRADLFTQDVFDGGDGTMYLDTRTRMLSNEASFSSGGVSLQGMADGYQCDLNGDGVTDAKDADHLLEYLVGNEAELHADGDISGDGVINSYDAHLLLTKQSGSYSVEVPASGSVTVDVKLTLTDETRSFLAAHYPTGAYIEGFVFAESAEGVDHSIPVLGYYGSWTEPGMYDVGSYVEHLAGAETRTPYLYSVNDIRSNFVTINYGDGDEYLFGGNPIVEEAEYLPQRNAFNNQSGHTLQSMRYSLIRNAAQTALLLTDADTGEIYMKSVLDAETGAYYHANSGAWQNTQSRLGLSLDLEGIPEGTNLELSLAAAPELYVAGDGSVDYDALGEGAFLTTRLTIDNTAPELQGYSLTGSTLTVTAKDNQYIAAVALLNNAGTSILASEPGDQTTPNTTVTAHLNLSQVFGSSFLLAVFDYAENVTTYAVELELDNERPRFTGINISTADSSYVGMNETGGYVTVASTAGRQSAQAAEYVDGWVFEITADGRLYVGSDGDLFTFRELSVLDPEGVWEINGFNDLAYNTADGKLYGSFYSELNNMNVPYLFAIDLYTGAMTVLGELPVDVNSLAADDEGNFYGTTYSFSTSKLYTFRSDVVSTGAYTLVGTLGGYGSAELNALAWDHDADELYWALPADTAGYLLQIDPATAAVTYVNSFDFNCVGLYIATEEQGDTFAPVDEVVSVSLPEKAGTIVGQSVLLNAAILPWNVSDDSVTWSSSDTAVAAVDSIGRVTGVSAGTAVITAVSNLDSTKSASCTVTVSAVDQELKAVIWDEDGRIWWSEFRADGLPVYTELSEAAEGMYFATTAVANGTLYAGTNDGEMSPSSLYIVDPETYEATLVGGSTVVCYTDLAWAPNLGYLIATYGGYLCLVDPANGEYIGAFTWGTNAGLDLVGVTYLGSEYNESIGSMVDSFLLLDENGDAYMEGLYAYGSGYYYMNGPEEGFLANIGDPVDTAMLQGFHFDGEYAYWTRLNMSDDVVELIVWDVLDTGAVYDMGQFPGHVWPVSGLYTDAEITGSNALTEAFAEAIPQGRAMVQSIEPVTAAAAPGGLNAAAGLLSSGELDDAGSVTVSVTIPAEAPSGMIEVRYDPEKLELTGVQGRTEAFAWADNGSSVKLAFAAGEALGEDTQAAGLTFAAVGMGGTDVVIDTLELGGEPSGHSQTISLTLPNNCTHENTVFTGAYPASCTAEGYTGDLTCADCGELLELGSAIPATGHTWDEGVITRQPTEDSKGEMLYTCTACGETWTKAIPELGHEHSYEASVTGPTCTEQGFTTYTCADCGDSYTDDYTDALGHSFGEWTLIRKPTGTAEGLELRVCTRCGHTEERAIPVLENPFTDVKPGSFYYNPVLWAVEAGITKGMTDTTFEPNGECTRGQVVTFLWRAAGSPEPTTTEHPFTDVTEGKFYYKAMLWAVENGITSGMTDTTFEPNGKCTRAQVVTFLHRAKGKPEPTTTEHPFTDVTEGKFYYTAMLWAVENGITSGMTDTTFVPGGICTRGQVVTFLYRAYAEA